MWPCRVGIGLGLGAPNPSPHCLGLWWVRSEEDVSQLGFSVQRWSEVGVWVWCEGGARWLLVAQLYGWEWACQWEVASFWHGRYVLGAF